MTATSRMSRRTQQRKMLMRVIEDETYNRLLAEWRSGLAERGLPGDLVLEARDAGRRRFDRYVASHEETR